MEKLNLKTVNKDLIYNVVINTVKSDFREIFKIENENEVLTGYTKISDFDKYFYMEMINNYNLNPERETLKKELENEKNVCKEICKYFSYKVRTGRGSNAYRILFSLDYIVIFKENRDKIMNSVSKILIQEIKKDKVKKLELFAEMFNENSSEFLNGTYSQLAALLAKNNILTKKDFVRNLEMIKDSFNYYIKRDRKRKEILAEGKEFFAFIETRSEPTFKVFLTNGLKTIELELPRKAFYVSTHGHFSFLNKSEIEAIIRKEFKKDEKDSLYIKTVNNKFSKTNKYLLEFVRSQVQKLELKI